jgi:hypothetical protein
MEFGEIYRCAIKEAEWLKYYGHCDTRLAETFDDHLFYDRIESIGYTKVVMPLHLRCAMLYVAPSPKCVELDPGVSALDLGPNDVIPSYGPKTETVLTALEYIVARFPALRQEFIKMMK